MLKCTNISGKRVRSRFRRVKNTVTSRLRSEDNESSAEALNSKSESLRRALELNETLAAALRDNHDLKKELEDVLEKLRLSEMKIAEIKQAEDYRVMLKRDISIAC